MASARRTLAAAQALEAGLITTREAMEISGVNDEAALQAATMEAARSFPQGERSALAQPLRVAGAAGRR